MGCPPCDVSATTERADMTARGYRRFRCHTCERRCADWSAACSFPYKRASTTSWTPSSTMARTVCVSSSTGSCSREPMV